MKTVLLLLVLLFCSAGLFALTMQSTALGGNWTAPSTWVGGVVPGSGDNAVINGLVYVNGTVYCWDLTIASTGSLMNDGPIRYLHVSGAYINFGSCENNPATGYLVLNPHGSFADYGVQSNTYINFDNSGMTTTIYQDPDASPIASPNVIATSSSGQFTLLSDLRFQGSVIDFTSRTLNTGEHSISLNGGRLYRIVLNTEGYSSLILSGSAYLTSVNAEDIILQGTALITTDVSFHHLVNYADLTTQTTGPYNLTINGNLTNYALIHNSSGTISLRLYGNLANYHTITCNYIYFDAATAQHVFEDAAANPFTCNLFGKAASTTGGSVVLDSDLYFHNTSIDLYGHTLQMSQGASNFGLTLDGGMIYRTTADTEDFCTVSLSNGAYLYNFTGEDIILQGTALIYQGVSFHNLFNYADLTTQTTGTYNLTVNGNLVNHGSIHNASGNVYLQLWGDLYVYGTISCYYVYFNGGGNQHVFQYSAAPPLTCHQFGKPSSVTTGSLYMLSDLRFQNVIVDMNYRQIMMFYEDYNYALIS